MSEKTIECLDCNGHFTARKTRRGLCIACYGRRRSRGTPHEAAPSLYRRWEVGDRYPDRNGYILVKMSDGSRRHEHRIVYEEFLGRPLVSDETVHHKNGNRSDNGLENLELWFKGQPAGQRVDDLVDYLVRNHLRLLLAAIDREVTVCL